MLFRSRVIAEITREDASYIEAATVAVLDPSPQRVEPKCEYFGVCGGCQLQHIAYPEQLRLKTEIVRDQLRRIGRFEDAPLQPMLGMDNPWGYRNHLRFTVRRDGDVGFMQHGTHRFLRIDHCEIAHPRVNKVLRDVQAQLQDAAHSLKGTLHHTDLEPDRLAELDQRMGAWMSLARRYRRPPAELAELLQGWRDELAALDKAADLDGLQAEVDEAHARWLKQAQAASRLRHQAAPRWAEAITAAMQDLGMSGGRFDVALQPLDTPHANGLEAIDFLVAGHAGSTPRPLGKVASGGELSRLALAIAVTAAQDQDDAAHVPTLIFDEIDSGIGGEIGRAHV